jgi:predicted FMN-binding regulatory protein PaiB
MGRQIGFLQMKKMLSSQWVGKGGATQAITKSEIKIDKIVDLNKLQRNIERYDTLLGVTNTLKSANTAACRQNKALIEESTPNLNKIKK